MGRIQEPKRCWAPPKTRPLVGQQGIREYTYAYGVVSPLDGVADFFILPVVTAQAMNLLVVFQIWILYKNSKFIAINK